MSTQHETRKTLALLAGIVLTCAGAVLLFKGVQGGATIDIIAGLVGGRIESGSAGVLLCFLGVIVILASFFGRGRAKARRAGEHSGTERRQGSERHQFGRD